jgi:hypothetical protein
MTRLDRLIEEYIHDPYFVREKYPDPSVCVSCGLLFRDGIFEWSDKRVENAAKMTCPACRRTHDNYEGGRVYLEGEFISKRKDEILNIIKNTEKLEKKYRPLERIISLVEESGRLTVATTYEHIARRIGEAVHRAYKGELKIQYPEMEKYIRVYWKRDN